MDWTWLVELLFLTPLRWVTFGFLLTITIITIQKVIGRRLGTDYRRHAAVEWIVFLLGFAGFAVWNIPQNPHDTPHDNGIRGVAYTILILCVILIYRLGLYLWRTKLDTVRGSRSR